MPRRKLTACWPILLFAIPFVFFYFGLDSLFFRTEMRAAAMPLVAQVVETDTCKASDGNRRSCRVVASDLPFEMDGPRYDLRLLDGNFDPEDVPHSVDIIPPSDQPTGANTDVLVRPDLDYRVAIVSFWSGYVLPIVLLGLGTFWFLGSLVIAPNVLKDNLGNKGQPTGGTS